MDVMALAHAERSDLAAFLATVSPDQWESPSVCAGWSARDVVEHVVSYEEHGPPYVLRRLARARFRVHRLNEVALAEYRHQNPEELLDFLRQHLEPGVPRRVSADASAWSTA